MRRRCTVTCLALFLILLPWCAWGQEQAKTPTVAVFPFTVFGPKRSARMGRAVQDLLIRQLQQEGVRTVNAPAPVASDAQARAQGRRMGADFAIYGTLSLVGEEVSVDAKLADVKGGKRTKVLYAEQRGVENLASATRQITDQAAIHLLSKAIIADIRVEGNERIEPDAILVAIHSHKGELLRPETVGEDIKAIYKMGYFESVDAYVTDSPDGKILTFKVREKPTVVEVKIKGNKHIKDKDILAAINTKAYTILQKNVVNDDIQRIIKLYHQKAYFNAEVRADIDFPQDPRHAVVTFNITENNRVFIKKIEFKGNKHFASWRLRMIMQTKARSIFLWFTDRGILQRDVLETDIDRLGAFYHDHGYMSAKVGSPEIDLKDDGFYITIPIEEGERYKVKSVDITGELLEDSDKIKKKLVLKPGDYFSREKLRKDLDTITKAYMDQGYAHTEVVPEIRSNKQEALAIIRYHARRGPKVRIDTITISGNTKTRDKVIRRQMELAEGDLFSSSKLEHSNMKLRKLDYFEQVEISPLPGDTPDTMKLHIKVKEKATGSLSVGGGFSSDDGVFLGGDIQQRNLFGRGQFLSLKAYVSKSNTQYSFSFTEPWLFDTPLSAGIDLYNWEREYTDFTKNAIGGKLRFSHPFGDWSRWYLSYLYEDADVTDVADDAATIIKDQEGRQVKSSVSGSLERDTTDDAFAPTRGSINRISLEYSIPYLGSDSDFLKFVVNSGWYFPLYWKFVGFVRGKFGWIEQFDEENKPVPIYDRFFLGGMNSLRAFGWGDVGPEDPETGDIIGGTKFGLVNVELLFPLLEKLEMRGVVFFDAGNSFDTDESFDVSKFRTDVGAGIRWKSPMGPIRIEYGYNLDRKPGESQGKWQFSMGAFF